MDEVRRQSDDELCGFVEQRAGEWCALTVFGAVLARYGSRDAAAQHVLDEGLASLAERWTLRHCDGGEEIVCIHEANADLVRVARDYLLVARCPDADYHGGTTRRG